MENTKYKDGLDEHKKLEYADEMEKILIEMAEYVCDRCEFTHFECDQKEMDWICDSCKMEKFIDAIRKEYDRINDFEKSQCAHLLKEIAKLQREKEKEIAETIKARPIIICTKEEHEKIHEIPRAKQWDGLRTKINIIDEMHTYKRPCENDEKK